MFPISLDENISDILRGYIIQYFAWKLRGAVIYYISDSFIKNKLNNNFNYSNDKKTYLE